MFLGSAWRSVHVRESESDDKYTRYTTETKDQAPIPLDKAPEKGDLQDTAVAADDVINHLVKGNQAN